MGPLKRWLATVRATRRIWQTLLVVLDLAGILLATVLTYYLRFEGVIPQEYLQTLWWFVPLSCLLYTFIAGAFGLYRVVLRYVGIDTLVRTAGAVFCTLALLVLGDLVVASFYPGHLRPIPLGVLVIQAAFVLMVIGGIRITVRAVQHLRVRTHNKGARLVIVGAGTAGTLLLRDLSMRPELEVSVVGFLDDDPQLKGTVIAGVPVIGLIEDLETVVKDYAIDQLFVALPTADDERVRAILNRSADLGLITRIMPKIVVERGKVSLSDMRQVNVEDLLGRPLTPVDDEGIESSLAQKTVLVTGAAGSIGSELCRQIAHFGAGRLLLCDIDESRLYELWFEIESLAPGLSEMHLLDIRNQAKVERLFMQERPDVVLHAAAYKHVPLMEMEPAEAVRTNVYGTRTVMEAAGSSGVSRFVLISTDKAVAPANVMGKTKQLAERLMLTTAQNYPDMDCVAVRFGNVLGSRGSVVPIFESKLLRGEPLTVTDPEVNRYFMVIPEAARLVLQAQVIGHSGDIFVLEMGDPVKIVDLARKMIALSGIPADIVFTGLRPGEKLHEVLLTGDEILEPTGAAHIDRVMNRSVGPLDDATYSKLVRAAQAGTLEAQAVLDIPAQDKD